MTFTRARHPTDFVGLTLGSGRAFLRCIIVVKMFTQAIPSLSPGTQRTERKAGPFFFSTLFLQEIVESEKSMLHPRPADPRDRLKLEGILIAEELKSFFFMVCYKGDIILLNL